MARDFSLFLDWEKKTPAAVANCLARFRIKYLWKSTGRSPSFPSKRARLGATCLVQAVHQRCRTLLTANIAPRHHPARTRLLANMLLEAVVVLKFLNIISLIRKRCHPPATQLDATNCCCFCLGVFSPTHAARGDCTAL